MVVIPRPIVIGVLLAGIVGGGACVPRQDSMQRIYEPPPTKHTKSAETPKASVKRFQEPMDETPTPVESTIELAEKYASLMQEAEALRMTNKEIEKQNQELNLRVISLESDLKQTQAELTQANSLLMEILGELNTWKNDVLGFRSEMRQAAKAELEALLKILQILGAEVPDVTAAPTVEAEQEQK